MTAIRNHALIVRSKPLGLRLEGSAKVQPLAMVRDGPAALLTMRALFSNAVIYLVKGLTA